MAKVRLTKTVCDEASYPATSKGMFCLWDTMVPGLALRVYPSGRKSWQLVYRTDAGRQRWVTVGHYLHLTVDQARDQARRIYGQRASGDDDPALTRRRAGEGLTVEALCEMYVSKYAKQRKRSWKEDERTLATNFVSRFGKMAATEVTRADLREMLEAVAKNAPVSANRLLAVVRKMFNWAVDEDILPSSPVGGLKAPSVETRRERVLNLEEIATLWTALPYSDSGRVLRLVLVTAQRPGEVLGIRWEEIEGKWWTIPAERVKAKRAQRVFLTPLAFSLLGQRGEGQVFDLAGNNSKALPHAAAKFCASEAWKGFAKWTPHDLRRTAATNLAALGVPRVVLTQILNHADRSMTAVYDRHSYDDEKREAMERWAVRLLEITVAKV